MRENKRLGTNVRHQPKNGNQKAIRKSYFIGVTQQNRVLLCRSDTFRSSQLPFGDDDIHRGNQNKCDHR